MPLKKVISEFRKGVLSSFNNQKENTINSIYQKNNGSLPSKHIYYEPPEEFYIQTHSPLISSGDVVVHRLPTSPESGHQRSFHKSTLAIENQIDAYTKENRPLTEAEFTSAILSRSRAEGEHRRSCPSLSPADVCGGDPEINASEADMADSGVMSMTVVSNGQSVCDGREECDCERRPSNHNKEGRNGDYSVSPVLERRSKGVFGRLRNLTSRTSYSTSEDGHSHSSDYEDQEDEKKADARFSRDARERSSSSWAGRVRDLHRDVKKKISKLRKSTGATPDEDLPDCGENTDHHIQAGSSVESIPSGSGSSLQPPTPTSSNRSSTSAGEDDHNSYVGSFIGKALALVDCTPSPYDKDGLSFKKGEIIDIIAKNKTGSWIGMAQGKVGHFKFINVEEIIEEKKNKHRHRKVNNNYSTLSERPKTLEELLQQINLEEYANVLILNGYDELETFKEIEKMDLNNLGITDSDHCSKLMRAAEMLHDIEPEGDGDDDNSQFKQSPRDSGCYASNENLVQRDSSQRALNNEHFTVDLEGHNTSHSESGVHSVSAMNNLDISLKRSESPTSMVIINNNHVSDAYNILPSSDIPDSNGIEDRHVTVESPPSLNALCVPYFHTTSGTKSSPGSPRKIRTRHTRNKSHSHRGRDLVDYPFASQTCGFAKCRLPANRYGERVGYVHGWASFAINGRNLPRNYSDYDDVVSDPNNDGKEVTGKNSYRKPKQRKGSLQTLIHDIRPPSPTLLSSVNKKLSSERIYLHEEPYTDKTGFCGIPPALVQRYAEELQRNIVDVAEALDQVRITALQQQTRRGVPNDFLSDSCIVPIIEPSYSSLEAWLISLGLPMYVPHFQKMGVTELYQVMTLSDEDLAQLGVRDTYHAVYLESAIEALCARYHKTSRTVTDEQGDA